MMMPTPPHVIEYHQNGVRLIAAVNINNPHYKTQIGEFIYEYVEKIAGEDKAPKITGMLIDLPLPEIISYLQDFNKLNIKINEANSLLMTQQ
jgi:Poly-adenylate binding protein, unique domain